MLLWVGRKIHKNLKRCSVTVGEKYTKLKKGALLLWEKNICVGGK